MNFQILTTACLEQITVLFTPPPRSPLHYACGWRD